MGGAGARAGSISVDGRVARDDGHAARRCDRPVARFGAARAAASSRAVSGRPPCLVLTGGLVPLAGRDMTGERGLTLLEVLVALVVLTLVGLGYLQLLHQSHRLVASSREWSDAVVYAEDGMERAKLGSVSFGRAPAESLPGGFRRQFTRRLWQPGSDLVLVTVTVSLPEGGRFDLYRLARPRPLARADSASPGEDW
ncbi:MAG: hypothetical protein DMD36_14560 [Gemmatimonadetes bacterium]|nr:MAG: hypothetical protein DMD36_14560 [Gemmatimonadota bacterium]